MKGEKLMKKQVYKPNIDIYLAILNRYASKNKNETDFIKRKKVMLVLSDIIEFFLKRSLNYQNLEIFNLYKQFIEADKVLQNFKILLFKKWKKGGFSKMRQRVNKILQQKDKIESKILEFKVEKNWVLSKGEKYWQKRIMILRNLLLWAEPMYHDFLREFETYQEKDIIRFKKAIGLK